jgi:hypothetical protein
MWCMLCTLGIYESWARNATGGSHNCVALAARSVCSDSSPI